jgi:hypothetical protein
MGKAVRPQVDGAHGDGPFQNSPLTCFLVVVPFRIHR